MKTLKIWRDATRPTRAWLALAVFTVSAAAGAASLTEAEKKEGLAQLERTRAGVVEATKGLSEAQWKFKPGPDRWSVAEVLEHIALSEDMLLGNTSKQVMAAPAGAPDRDYKAGDKMVLTVIPDRSRRAQAPDALVPTGRWSPQEALDHFLKNRARTVEFLKSTPDLREHVVDSPIGQPLDAYQWLLFNSAHSERHTKQILEVKADPNFPKK
jgi:hypothetical protein